MAHGSSLRYSISRPQEQRRTTKFTRREVIGDDCDVPSPTQPIKIIRAEGGTPAAPAVVQFGKTELQIERWGEYVAVLLPGAVRLVGTRDQVTTLIAALTATTL